MSRKRKLSDGSRESAEKEIKLKQSKIVKEDPPAAFFVQDPFVKGTAEIGVDPFNQGMAHYNDPLPRAPPALRTSTVLETNRTIVWLLPNAECNCKEAQCVWQALSSTPLEHYSRPPVIIRIIEQFLPVVSGRTSSAPLADLVYSYMRSRTISYGELWSGVRALFHSRQGPHMRALLGLGVQSRLSDAFEFSTVDGFQSAVSHNGNAVVMWPIFKLVHQ